MTFHYYATRADGWRQDALTYVTGLPAWARMIVMLLALPGILLIGLSLLMLLASIAALLLLTVPAYSLLRRLTGIRQRQDGSDPNAANRPTIFRPTRRVEATVID